MRNCDPSISLCGVGTSMMFHRESGMGAYVPEGATDGDLQRLLRNRRSAAKTRSILRFG